MPHCKIKYIYNLLEFDIRKRKGFHDKSFEIQIHD